MPSILGVGNREPLNCWVECTKLFSCVQDTNIVAEIRCTYCGQGNRYIVQPYLMSLLLKISGSTAEDASYHCQMGRKVFRSKNETCDACKQHELTVPASAAESIIVTPQEFVERIEGLVSPDDTQVESFLEKYDHPIYQVKKWLPGRRGSYSQVANPATSHHSQTTDIKEDKFHIYRQELLKSRSLRQNKLCLPHIMLDNIIATHAESNYGTFSQNSPALSAVTMGASFSNLTPCQLCEQSHKNAPSVEHVPGCPESK